MVSGIPWIIFFVAIIGWSIFSVVFLFHWRHYSRQSKPTILAEMIYFVVSITLIGLILNTLNWKEFYSIFFNQ
ncbi:MAG: hypothetical protein AAB677_01940 [Patescibacteria group bacterium]